MIYMDVVHDPFTAGVDRLCKKSPWEKKMDLVNVCGFHSQIPPNSYTELESTIYIVIAK